VRAHAHRSVRDADLIERIAALETVAEQGRAFGGTCRGRGRTVHGRRGQATLAAHAPPAAGLNVKAAGLNVNYCLFESLLFLTLTVFNRKTMFSLNVWKL